MAVTLEQIAALDAALSSGELTVRSRDGASVVYRSVDELLRARNALAVQYAAEQAAAGVSPPRRRLFRLFHMGRGFDA